VAVPDAARYPGGPATGQVDVPAGLVEVLRQLAARLAAADDQDASRRQGPRVAVAVGIEDREAGGQVGGARWPVRALVSAGREHHRARVDGAGRSLEQETA